MLFLMVDGANGTCGRPYSLLGLAVGEGMLASSKGENLGPEYCFILSGRF